MFFSEDLYKSLDFICFAGIDDYSKYTNSAWKKFIVYTKRTIDHYVILIIHLQRGLNGKAGFGQNQEASWENTDTIGTTTQYFS